MQNQEKINEFTNKLKSLNGNIVCLTGAGISAESGLSTFRSNDGLWDSYDVTEVASYEGFLKNPSLVHEFYNIRRREINSDKISENLAHKALAKIENHFKDRFWLITQNIDNLHERAKSKNVIHLHGEVNKIFCLICKKKQIHTSDLTLKTKCKNCQTVGKMREDIVWFGEMPYHLDQIYSLLNNASCFISIGTSGKVYPAAGFVSMIPDHAISLEINLEKSDNSEIFQYSLQGKATILTEMLAEVMINNL